MFQGAETNLKSWNEYTKSRFLDILKELGAIYTYQDKVKILEKNNPKTFKAFILKNKGHMIYNKIQPAKMIIKYIKDLF
jgi:hypothetical protein